jgi:small subunit ribosomal protein S6
MTIRRCISMEKKICSYETLFAVSGNLVEEETKALVEKFVNLVKENASDVTVNEWGKRRLAYPINYITEGYYVLVTFKSEPSFPLELERVLGITEGVLRYMTTTKIEKAAKAEEVVEAPEATAEVEVTEA